MALGLGPRYRRFESFHPDKNFKIMEIGKPFKSIDSYNNAMAQSIEDKLFFLEKLPKEDYLFVDFGCADGTLINELQKLVPGSSFVGYDPSEEMLQRARLKTPTVKYTNDWYEVIMEIKHSSKKSVLILSSVIHEVYSYAESEQDIVNFWSRVQHTGFDYVVVRDMIPDKSIDRESEPEEEIKILRRCNRDQLFEFESHFGLVSNNQNLVHFLLKYRYTVNWDREVNENYFPIYKDEFLEKFSGFELTYIQPFKVVFLMCCIKKDFDIWLKDDTHIKAVFKNVKS